MQLIVLYRSSRSKAVILQLILKKRNRGSTEEDNIKLSSKETDFIIDNI